MSDDVVNYQQEMDALVERSRQNKSMVLPYTLHKPLPVQAGPGRVSKGMLKRLNGARSYAAGQTVAHKNNTMIEFPDVTRFDNNGSGIIIGAKLTKTNTLVQSVAFRLWLYQITFPLDPVTKDGNPYEIRWQRRDDRIGYLDFDTFYVGQDCAESQAYVGLGQSLLFTMGSANSLYGILQTLTPYPALSAEEMHLYLHISQD